VRPREGDQITVLVEVRGVPVTYLVSAGRISGNTLMVPRLAGQQGWAVEPQGAATVLFTRDGRWYNWPMRVEEVLPSSYYLVSDQDPGEGERRQFVRSQVSLRVSVCRGQGAGDAWHDVSADLSASGIRLALPAGLEDDEQVTVAIRADGHPHTVTALARVARREATSQGDEMVALEFERLSSSDEERLAQIVMRSRESVLQQRIGRREPRTGAG